MFQVEVEFEDFEFKELYGQEAADFLVKVGQRALSAKITFCQPEQSHPFSLEALELSHQIENLICKQIPSRPGGLNLDIIFKALELVKEDFKKI